MTPPPLAIVQARLNSTRLPRKMLLPLAGHPLIWHAWRASVEAFGTDNVVIAMPAGAGNDELAEAVAMFAPQVFRWDGPENDVLGRFYHCAHTYRWHPDSVIVRVTPDDPRKDVLALRRVAQGYRLPVELGGEAFTLAMLDAAVEWAYDLEVARAFRVPDNLISTAREHITHALFATPPPPPPPGTWTVDTEEDYAAMRRVME